MNMTMKVTELAINGGPKARTTPWPNPGLIGLEEKAAVDALFDEAIASGNAIVYNGVEEEAYCNEFSEYLGKYAIKYIELFHVQGKELFELKPDEVL
jgi:hypothetical protein